MSLGAASPSPDPAAVGPAAAGPAASGSVEASGGIETAALAGTVLVYADSIQLSARAAALVKSSGAVRPFILETDALTNRIIDLGNGRTISFEEGIYRRT